MYAQILVTAILALGSAVDERALATSADPTLFAVNVILNSDFESVADSTTEPVKRGAYWRDAFVHQKGDPTDRIVAVADDQHALLLAPDAAGVCGPVSQIVTLYGPAAERFEMTLRVRFADLAALPDAGVDATAPRGALLLQVQSQGERAIRYRIGAGDAGDDTIPIEPGSAVDAEGFCSVRLPVGADFVRVTGGPPAPWNRLILTAADGPVLVDDVYGSHFLPRIQPRELRELLLQDVRDMLAVFLGKDGTPVPGLELVDRRSGYQVGVQHNVVTGEVLARSTIGVRNGIHDIMLAYLETADDAREHQPLRLLVRRIMQAHLKSYLTNNVYEPTGLYCLYDVSKGQPIADQAVVPTSFIHYVLDVTELPYPELQALRGKALERVEKMADQMVEIRKQHDLPPDKPFGRGPRGNWFGRMPEKLTPEGALDVPHKHKGTYDQAWAIKSNRSWYHDFDSAEGIARVHGLVPKASYAETIDRVIELFDRVFDAERYDLENDTDDHYGMNVEALLHGYRSGGHRLTQLRDFAQTMTDYRLPRDLPWHQNLWVEGIRLGSFTTGDQPRAYRGPVWLHNTPQGANPASSGWRGYEYALRELAKSDLKRRLLDDGYMTEASSYQWEMISACYDGSYIGPCSENRKWEGDMGDQFAGPSANSFRALGRTLELCRRGPDKEFVAWYYLVQAHTAELYRQRYGYRFGMSKETGRRYGIPERYLAGFSDTEPYMLATTVVHAETLSSVDLDYVADTVRIAEVRLTADGAVRVAVTGPAGRSVHVSVADHTAYSEVGITDWRLRFTPAGAPSAEVVLDAKGRGQAVVVCRLGDSMTASVDAILPTPDGLDVDDVASGEYRL